MHVGDTVFARAKLLVTNECILCLKSAKATIAQKVAVIMHDDVAHFSGKIRDPGEVPISVKKMNFGLAYVPTAVNRVPRFSVIAVKPDHVDRDVEPLLDFREINQTYEILDHSKPVLRKVRIRISPWSICMSVV